MLYFIKCGEFVKIGLSSNPWRRMAEIQAQNPQKAEMLAVLPGGYLEEMEHHTRFARDWYSAEWYRDSDKLRQYVEQVRATYPELQTSPPASPSTKKGARRRWRPTP